VEIGREVAFECTSLCWKRPENLDEEGFHHEVKEGDDRLMVSLGEASAAEDGMRGEKRIPTANG
jgi:hypothetical protein